MTSPESIARQFKRVRYSYHRDLFTLLGHPDIAHQFDKIWNLCEPHMETDPHEPLVGGQPPEYWLKEWIPYINNPTFYATLIEVLEAEATVDEEKGRTKLALLLRHVIRLIEPLCIERIYIETTHHVGCDACGKVPEPPYLVISRDEDTALSACMACVKRVLDEYEKESK